MLAGTDDELFCAFLIDVLGFVQRNGVCGYLGAAVVT
jgi:hypothetical protein